MAVDCQTCLAVSGGGRIRLTERGSLILMDLLDKKRRHILPERRAAIEYANAETLRSANETLRDIELLREEIERTQSEMGWLDGQPQRTHP